MCKRLTAAGWVPQNSSGCRSSPWLFGPKSDRRSKLQNRR